MREIGLLGGTFDPVHYGHLLAAQVALDGCGLDEVWFIPTNVPPHKPQPGASSTHRAAMLQLALAGNPGFRIEDIELQKDGTSYTIETVTGLQHSYPELSFLWILGSDMIQDLPNWREIEQLARRISFIGLERPDQPSDESRLPDFIRGRLTRASMPPMGLSSTAIRSALRSGRSVRYMLPDPVIDYIQRNGLYES
jgi:nicotinate-nucleotide adenylyltransferase